mmetsp:Transcript_88750/g.129768  ORF Transcript_88750/g.129768 Transcript_88750/m.129768 type:complete len:80 (-) Transcript_88750:794-1033(-)
MCVMRMRLGRRRRRKRRKKKEIAAVLQQLKVDADTAEAAAAAARPKAHETQDAIGSIKQSFTQKLAAIAAAAAKKLTRN